MLNEILPLRFIRALAFVKTKQLHEIRLRVGLPTVLLFDGRYYLGENGFADNKDDALKVTQQELADIIFRGCECSVYAYNEEIKQGFITLNGGIRLGICGEVVTEKGQVKTIKNFNSINIRFPHIIKNCSLNAVPYLYKNEKLFNTLVIAPPGAGKTTFIRDLATQLSDKNICKNILIIDERNEISACVNGKPSFYTGINCDIMSNCSKDFGIINGIRTMAPDVIILDELANSQHITQLQNVFGSGVSVVATVHSTNIRELHKKPFFDTLLKDKIFERYVVLSFNNGVGTIEGVWNDNEECLYIGD